MQTIPEKEDDLQPVMSVFKNSVLNKIIQKSALLIELDKCMQSLLPASFAPHCQVMNISEYTLVLGVTSAAISTRIQFLSAELLESLRNDDRFSRILSIRCKVVPTIMKR